MGTYSFGVVLPGITPREMKDAFSSITRDNLGKCRDGALIFRTDHNWIKERQSLLQLVPEIDDSS